MSVFPTPPAIQNVSRVYDLKARLDWGEPALTIIDVRSRDEFNDAHIVGALSFPVTDLVEQASSSIELVRDVYVYGATDQETSEAAAKLREAGYEQVAELKGGMAAWKAVGYPLESVALAA